MDAPTEKTVQYLPSDQVRDTLGSRMAWVNGTGGILIITASGAPDGALVPPACWPGPGWHLWASRECAKPAPTGGLPAPGPPPRAPKG